MEAVTAVGEVVSLPGSNAAMPWIFRAMKEKDGKPMLGASGSTLGVRSPGGAGKPDIAPDAAGNVIPGTGGMSVSPSVRQLLDRLPPGLIPRRLKPLAPDAVGSNNIFVWRMGEGPFAAANITTRLALRPDPQDAGHGLIEPAGPMPLEEYVSALAATRDEWTVDEEVESS